MTHGVVEEHQWHGSGRKVLVQSLQRRVRHPLHA
jgi:hypothetical protein